MTQLEALNIAYEELSNMMPDGENDDIFEAAEVIEKMIHTKERLKVKQRLKSVPRSKKDNKRAKEINNMFDDLLNDLDLN